MLTIANGGVDVEKETTLLKQKMEIHIFVKQTNLSV